MERRIALTTELCFAFVSAWVLLMIFNDGQLWIDFKFASWCRDELMILNEFWYLQLCACVSLQKKIDSWMVVGNDKKRFSRLDDYFGLAPRVLLPLAPRLQTKLIIIVQGNGSRKILLISNAKLKLLRTSHTWFYALVVLSALTRTCIRNLDDYFGLAPRVLLPLAPEYRLRYCAGQTDDKFSLIHTPKSSSYSSHFMLWWCWVHIPYL